MPPAPRRAPTWYLPSICPVRSGSGAGGAAFGARATVRKEPTGAPPGTVLTLGLFRQLHVSLGLAGDFPEFGPMHHAFVNSLGIVVFVFLDQGELESLLARRLADKVDAFAFSATSDAVDTGQGGGMHANGAHREAPPSVGAAHVRPRSRLHSFPPGQVAPSPNCASQRAAALQNSPTLQAL